MNRDAERAAIIRAAGEAGIDPSAALAIAARESNFDPSARSSKTIHGMFQMTGNLRSQYGIGDSEDPYAQASGWTKFFRANKNEMARSLGRMPSDAEGYLGHHFGGTRAARMLNMDPATPVDQVFSPYERSLNPHFDKAGTVGALNSSVLGDIQDKQRKFGGELPDFSGFGSPVGGNDNAQTAAADTLAPDFSSLGTPLQQPAAEAPSGQQQAPDFSKFGVAA